MPCASVRPRVWSRDDLAGGRQPIRREFRARSNRSATPDLIRAHARRETGRVAGITLKHVQAMTDDTGMLSTPSSASRATAMLLPGQRARPAAHRAPRDAGADDRAVVRALGSRYLASVIAFDRETGRFRNFLSTRGSGSSPGGRRIAMGALGARRDVEARARSRSPGLAGDLFPPPFPR